MIAFVRGPIAWVGADQAVVDVGGVGLALSCPARTLADLRVGEVRQLASTLVVREDSLTLFGFADNDERGVFETLQSVTGVGPRVALAMLGVLTPDEIRTAVTRENRAALTRTPGVGPKVAARIILELKDKLVAPATGPAPARPAQESWTPQVIAGLVALGWPARDAAAATDAVAEQAEQAVAAGKPMSVSELLRAALRHLDRA